MISSSILGAISLGLGDIQLSCLRTPRAHEISKQTKFNTLSHPTSSLKPPHPRGSCRQCSSLTPEGNSCKGGEGAGGWELVSTEVFVCYINMR